MVVSCRNGPEHLFFPERTFDHSGCLAGQRSNRQGSGLSASALRDALRLVLCAFPCQSRPGFCELRPWRIVVVFLRLYVHGQLLVFPCQRSGLFYLPFVRGRTSCQSRTMGLPCPGGDDRRLPRSVPSLPRGPFFMFLRSSPPYRALLMAAAADLTNIGSTGRRGAARRWTWRYFEREQLLRTDEQPARRRTIFPGRPIILQAHIWSRVVIALHDRSVAAIRKRSDGHGERFSRLAESFGSADDLLRTSIPCYFSSDICR